MNDEIVRRLRADLPRLADSALSADADADRPGALAARRTGRSLRGLVAAGVAAIVLIGVGLVTFGQSDGDSRVVAANGDGETATATPIDGAEVQIDIYSGRPNPTWTLGPADADRLWVTIESLPVLPDRAPVNDGLGFNGFTITAIDGNNVDVRVGQVVVESGDGDVIAHHDPSSEIMRELVALSIAAVDDAGLHDVLRTEIERIITEFEATEKMTPETSGLGTGVTSTPVATDSAVAKAVAEAIPPHKVVAAESILGPPREDQINYTELTTDQVDGRSFRITLYRTFSTHELDDADLPRRTLPSGTMWIGSETAIYFLSNDGIGFYVGWSGADTKENPYTLESLTSIAETLANNEAVRAEVQE